MSLLCPSCDAPLAERLIQEPVNLWSMWRCKGCGAYPVTSLLKPVRQLYTESYFEMGTVDTPRYSGYLSYEGYRPVLLEEFRERLKPFISSQSRVLDIGCATGVALEAAMLLGADERRMMGVDVSAYAIAHARKKMPHVTFLCGDVDSLHLEARYDVIMLWDVLEHVSRPAAVFCAAASWLAPGGVLLITTPDPESWMRKCTGRFWSEFRSGEHLCFFGREWFTRMSSQTGLRIHSFSRPTKRMTVQHLSSRISAYIPGFPFLEDETVLTFRSRDQLQVILQAKN